MRKSDAAGADDPTAGPSKGELDASPDSDDGAGADKDALATDGGAAGTGWEGPVPWVGTITAAPQDPRGSAPARVLHVADESGRSLEIGHVPPPDSAETRFNVVTVVGPYNFDVCPICLTADPTSAEHVPPERLGGQRMTLVCERCNNVLGTRLEADLLDWRDDAVRVRASGGDVRGTRTIGRVLHRTEMTGGFVLMANDTPDSSLRQMLSSGELTFEFAPPERKKVKLAALKSAYLAVCLQTRSIPMTSAAQEVRAELLSARDAPDRHSIPAGPHAQALRLWRGYGPPQGPSVALATPSGSASPLVPGSADADVIVWLAGTMGVSWPLPDVQPLL